MNISGNHKPLTRTHEAINALGYAIIGNFTGGAGAKLAGFWSLDGNIEGPFKALRRATREEYDTYIAATGNGGSIAFNETDWYYAVMD